MRPFSRRAGWRRRERLARADALVVAIALCAGWLMVGAGVVMAVFGL